MTDVIKFLVDRQSIEARKWQAQEKADSTFEDHEGIAEGFFNLLYSASYCGRIRYAPMGRHRLAWPDRTDLFSSVVTNGEDKIQLWRSWLGNLLPALAACPIGWQLGILQLLQRLGMNTSRRMTPGAVSCGVRETLLFMIASAMMERAEFPVQRNKTL